MGMETPKKGVIVFLGIGAVVIASLSLGRCRDVSDEAEAEAAAAEVEVLEMATAEQVDAFGRALITSLENNTLEDGLIDWAVLAGRTLPEGASMETRREFIESVEQGAANNDLLRQLRQRMEAGDRMNYRGVAERSDHPVARFRLIMATGGVDFFDFLIAIRDGEPKVVDFFQLRGGRWHSEGVADMFQGAFVEGTGAVQPNPLTDHAVELGNLGQLIQAGNPEEALRVYGELPEEVRHHRIVFGLAIDASSLLPLEDPRRFALLDEFEETFPNDPAASVRLLEAHFERRQWSAVHADLDALNGAFPDSYWLTLRARLLRLQGRLADAAAEAARSVELEPTLLETQDAALTVALAMGNTELADEAARTLRDVHGVRFEVIADNPDYAGVMDLACMQPDAPQRDVLPEGINIPIHHPDPTPAANPNPTEETTP